MKFFFAALISFVSLSGCQSISQLEGAADGGPVPNAIEHPIQSYKEVTIEQLNAWGFSVEATDLGEGEFGVYVHAQRPAMEGIASGRLNISFSLWSEDEQFVFAMPTVSLNQGPFLLIDGYILRVMVNVTNDALGLEPGVGYKADIDPAAHL